MENKMRLVSLTVLLTLLVGACAGTSNSGAPADSAVAGTPTVTPVVPLDDYLAYTVSIKTGEKTSERRVRLLSFRACRENASACTAEEIPSPAGVDPKQWFMLHWSEDGKLLYWDYSTASDQGKVSITRYSYNPETRTSQKEETAPSYV
jgi:hypothetical protein